MYHTLFSKGVRLTTTATLNSDMEIWTGILSSSVSVEQISVTLSGTATTCYASLTEVTGGLSVASYGGTGLAGTGVGTLGSVGMLLNNVVPANSLVVGFGYATGISYVFTPGFTYSYNYNLPLTPSCNTYLLSLGCQSAFISQASSFNFGMTFTTTTNPWEYGIVAIAISTSGAIVTQNTFNVGCYTPNILKSTTITGNTTYYYQLPYATNWALVGNTINIYIASYTSDGYHSTEPLTVGYYTTNTIGPVNANNPLYLLSTKTFTIATGYSATTIPLSWSPTIGIGNFQSFITLSTQYEGLKIYVCSATGSQYQDTADGYNPSIIYQQNVNSTALAFGGYITVTSYGLVQTVTSTITQGTSTIYSYATTSTTTVGTVTTVQTQIVTSVIFSLQGAAGGSYIELNLITYFPIWFLPLIFGTLGAEFGFGLGGLLYGLMIGLILGQLGGILPLWTVFIDVIMIYVLLRR